MTQDLLQLISNEMKGFSKGQKRIGAFILEHYDKAAFMTAAKLGETVGVSESTVVRFAAELGFEGYPQLQKSLQAAAHTVTAVIQPGQAHGAGKRNDDLHSKRADSDKSRIFVQREQIQRLQRGYIVPKVQRIRQRERIVHDLAVRLHRDKDQPDDRDHNCDCQKHHQDVAHAQLFSYSHGRPSQSFPRSSSV